jgi:RHS repeat-associated protein
VRNFQNLYKFSHSPSQSFGEKNHETIATQGGRFILGEAPLAYPVTINGDAASLAGGLGFYWKQISADNSSGPLWTQDTVASNGVTIQGHTWTPAETASPTHDFDGNLTNDGRWDYSWNAENRLTRMQTTTAAATAGVPRQRLDFVHDSQGRRVSKTLSTSTDGTNWTFSSNFRYLYDHWNLIAEYSAPSATSTTLTLEATHTWGIDLSGTPQGAGGVGGLLATHLVASPATFCFPAYDGNGNISAWVDETGAILARMDYSPFGQLIAQYKFTSDAVLSRMNFGFSTKFTDLETGLLYYGYRFYDPVTGRWPSRDPIEERGGINLYGFVGNNPTIWIDLNGLTVTFDKPVNEELLASIKKAFIDNPSTKEIVERLGSVNHNFIFEDLTGYCDHVNARKVAVETMLGWDKELGKVLVKYKNAHKDMKALENAIANCATFGCRQAVLWAIYHGQYESREMRPRDNGIDIFKKIFPSESTRIINDPNSVDQYVPGDFGGILKHGREYESWMQTVGQKSKEDAEFAPMTGENIMYVGSDEFAGFFGGVEKKSLPKWIETVQNWGTAPNYKGNRLRAAMQKEISFPGVGLKK